MIAVALNPVRSPVAVAGRGAPAFRRALLLAAGAPAVQVFIDDLCAPAELPATVVLHRRLPGPSELAGLRALWIAGLSGPEAATLAKHARDARALVNVEDRPELCDFHSVAEVRRGDLLISVSTGGRSPGLAARVRAWIADAFGPEWASRTADMGVRRDAWRAAGHSIPELARMTDEVVDTSGWLA